MSWSAVRHRAGLWALALAAQLLAQLVARSGLSAYGLDPPPRAAVAVATAFLIACGFSVWVAVVSRRNREPAHPVVALLVVWAFLSMLFLTPTLLIGD